MNDAPRAIAERRSLRTLLHAAMHLIRPISCALTNGLELDPSPDELILRNRGFPIRRARIQDGAPDQHPLFEGDLPRGETRLTLPAPLSPLDITAVIIDGRRLGISWTWVVLVPADAECERPHSSTNELSHKSLP